MKKINMTIETCLKRLKYREGAVDLEALLSEFDILKEEVDLPDTVSGVLDRRDSSHPIILVQKKHSVTRKRFTIAHEIGHFFLHNIPGIHMDRPLFFREENIPAAHRKMETEANQFAAGLLMPEPELKKEFGRLQISDNMISSLSSIFRVSEDAMFYRLKNLKLDHGF